MRSSGADTSGLSHLDDADLVRQRMPTTWYEGPFLGNGFLGCGIYAEPGTGTSPATNAGPNALRFNVQHSEVQDHRPEFGSLFGRPVSRSATSRIASAGEREC